MKGKYHIVIQNNKLHYELDIKRNITIIKGDSATGKTTLIGLIDRASRMGISSGISIACKKKCRTLNDMDWQLILSNTKENIIFVDEDNLFIRTKEFAQAVKESDNYFVIICREDLPHLPYSVEEIYGIHTSGKYNDLKRTYNELYKIYANTKIQKKDLPITPKEVITEDSNSGHQFFNAICKEKNINCISAGGKSNIRKILDKTDGNNILVIADGAAIGPEMNKLYQYMRLHDTSSLYLPESFEWMILKSGVISETVIQSILEHPEDYIDSKKYMSWERYFTNLLIENTKDTFLKYNKGSLNESYLQERIKNSILNIMEGISWYSNYK